MEHGAADEPGCEVDPAVLLGADVVDLGRLTDAEVVERLLAAERLRSRVDAACVALTGAFDARTLAAADGARSTPAWVSARVGVGFGHARADLTMARQLRHQPHVAHAAANGRITRDQTRALLAAREPGIEEIFDACEAVLVDEVATSTLAAGRRFLARWARDVRERFGIPEPDGTEPDGGHGPSRAHLSPVGDRWAGDLDLTGVDGELLAAAIATHIDDLWRTGVFTRDDGLDPSERRAIALVQLIERATRGGDHDATARPLILGIATLDLLTGSHPAATPADQTEPGDAPPDADGAAARLGRPTPDIGVAPGSEPGDVDTDTPTAGEPAEHPHPSRAASAVHPDLGSEAEGAGPVDGAGRGDMAPADQDGPGPTGCATSPPPWGLPHQGHPTGSLPDLDLAADPGADARIAGALAGIDPRDPFPRVISELSRTGPVHPEVLRRLACEGDIVPVYVGPDADQLDMGRTIRLANRAQRRALHIRDGGCQFPGCSVPPEGCIAHHMIWWDHGGPTDIHNLCLLCRHHHRLVHGGGFTIGRDPDGTITTRRTDDLPFTASLRPRTPLVAPRPPPRRHDAEDRELHDRARARIAGLIHHARMARTAANAVVAHHRPRSRTTVLRQ
ncbi:DUF222 domain-containing protein [Iamia majanohamensis]|uniref:DUF222 domain-containing protein n=1 Tax=Iamia majanohamensis TaxID=467976 RepID=A0AAF0BSI9_9ACTN|nr:HNH endonuclease signature motif containing protein [Iamia majanohamensis]WCO65332.1 DUF222 domain-containing protein [Iamia majanohamensis]